jgi:hypothetical protein
MAMIHSAFSQEIQILSGSVESGNNSVRLDVVYGLQRGKMIVTGGDQQ